MAIPNFEFPGITLTQSFSTATPPDIATLGTACIGPNYRLHRADVPGEQAKIEAEYTGSQLVTDIPNKYTVKGEYIDYSEAKQRLVVSGIYKYAGISGTLKVDKGIGTIVTEVILAHGNGNQANEQFGTRGVLEGDPIVVTTTGGARVVATVIGFSSVSVPEHSLPTGSLNAVVIDNIGELSNEAEVTAGICVPGKAEYSPSASTFSMSEGKVTINANLPLDISNIIDKAETTATLVGGSLYLEYRERNLSYVGTRGSVSSREEVERVVGAVHPDNPLGFALAAAVEAAGGTTVYFTATADESVDAYYNAADCLGGYADVYSLVPATDDADVIKKLAGYVEAVSSNERSKIRRSLWYGLDTRDELTLYEGRASKLSAEGGLTPIQLEDATVFRRTPYQKGDVLRIDGKDYDIKSTNLYNTAYVADSAIVVENKTVTLVRTAPTTAQTTEDIISRIGTSGNRFVCVWADGLAFNGIECPNYIGAAAAAGMRCHEVAWRPLSCLTYPNLAVLGKHGITYSQLEQIASNGVWVIANNSNGIACNMKALTTAASGNINLDNQCITSNVDEIALTISHTGEDLVGSSNISDTLLLLIEDTVSASLSNRMTNAPNMAVGPQLVSYTVKSVRRVLDNVYMDLEIEPPAPYNRLSLSLLVK